MTPRREAEPIRVVSYGDPAYLHQYETKFLEDGIVILKEADVPETLQKVAEDIRPNYPDVHIEDKYLATYTHGVVSIGMTWNSQEEVIGGFRTENYNQLTIAARLATREVVVSTLEGWQVLAESDWRIADRLMSAVVNGVNSPWKMGKVVGELR